jgi:hypothetical protein
VVVAAAARDLRTRRHPPEFALPPIRPHLPLDRAGRSGFRGRHRRLRGAARLRRRHLDHCRDARRVPDLHRLGHAHCIGVLEDDELVGGVYGLAIGRVFFGESMFSWRTNASKIAFFALARTLCEAGFVWLDGQVESGHLARLGARPLERAHFVAGLDRLCRQLPKNPSWAVGLRTNWPSEWRKR